MSESDMKADFKKLYDKAPYALVVGIAVTLLLKGLIVLIGHLVILGTIALVITAWRGKPLRPDVYWLTGWLLFLSAVWDVVFYCIIAPLILGGM